MRHVVRAPSDMPEPSTEASELALKGCPRPYPIEMCVIANKAEAAPLDPVVIARHYLLVDAGRVQTAPGAGRNQALIAIYEIGGIQAIATPMAALIASGTPSTASCDSRQSSS